METKHAKRQITCARDHGIDIATRFSVFLGTWLLLFGTSAGCSDPSSDPNFIEQYHQGDSNPWQAYERFDNFCAGDLWDPSQPCPGGNCTGALSSDHFHVDISGTEDRDEIYFFDDTFEPDGPGVTSGYYGILYGDGRWPGQKPFMLYENRRVMSIRYYDRGRCSSPASFGLLRRKFFQSTHDKIVGDTVAGKDISASLTQSLNTDRCLHPHLNHDEDYVRFERLFEYRLPTGIPPFVTYFDIHLDGGWRFATGSRCVDTRLDGNHQGDYVSDLHCANNEPGFEWRDNQLVLEDVVMNWWLAESWACYIDPICNVEWWILWWKLRNGLDSFAADMEDEFHDAMWVDNPMFQDFYRCEEASDCVTDPADIFNFNDMMFDVRCVTDYDPPAAPQCEDGTEAYSETQASNGCQLRPSRVTRVNMYPDRFEFVFMEKGEGTGGNTVVGLDGYYFLLERANSCLPHSEDPHTGEAGHGRVTSEWTCGNGKREGPEECDGAAFLDCEDVFGPEASGKVRCNDWCRYDYGRCCIPSDQGPVTGEDIDSGFSSR